MQECGHACPAKCHHPKPPPVPDYTGPPPTMAPGIQLIKARKTAPPTPPPAVQVCPCMAPSHATGVQDCVKELAFLTHYRVLLHTLLIQTLTADVQKTSVPRDRALRDNLQQGVQWPVQVAEQVRQMESSPTACPPCQQMLPMTCHGNHVTFFQHCCVAAPFTCGAACGQPLKCGNHTCAADCHPLNVSSSNVGYPSNFEVCLCQSLRNACIIFSCTVIETMSCVMIAMPLYEFNSQRCTSHHCHHLPVRK